MDQKPRKDGHDDFGHFKSEPMKFVLYLVRELRFAFEAAAASKWVTWWTCSAVLVGSALRISAHRGRHFRLIVDGISAGSWTAFQSDRGRRFSGIVDDGGGAQVIF